MNLGERTLRVTFTILFIIAGLLCLNQSADSLWFAGGTPNDFPNVWYQNGLIWGWRGLTLLALSVFFQFKLQRMRSSWIAKLIAIIVILGLIYPYAKEQFLIDSCLDSGGAWSEKRFECRR